MIKFKVGDTAIDVEKPLGDQLKDLREERDLTQEELASKAKVSRSSVNYIELGSQDPKYSTLRKLLIALGK